MKSNPFLLATNASVDNARLLLSSYAGFMQTSAEYGAKVVSQLADTTKPEEKLKAFNDDFKDLQSVLTKQALDLNSKLISTFNEQRSTFENLLKNGVSLTK